MAPAEEEEKEDEGRWLAGGAAALLLLLLLLLLLFRARITIICLFYHVSGRAEDGRGGMGL